MNRAGYRQLLRERGVYSDSTSSGAVNVLMEMQYYATKQLVGKLTKTSGYLTSDLVSTTGDQLFSRRNLPTSFDKDSMSAVNSQPLPEVKNLNTPSPESVLKYETVKSENQLDKITRPNAVNVVAQNDVGQDAAAQNNDGSDAHYPERKTSVQVSFEVPKNEVPRENPPQPVDDDEEEDFSKKLLMSDDEDDEEDEGGDRKRIRI